MNKAGIVNTIPPAKDSPIAATPEIKFASSILFFLKIIFKSPVPSIAAGIPAAIVIPTFNARYVLAAANTAASKHPIIIETVVSSGMA